MSRLTRGRRVARPLAGVTALVAAWLWLPSPSGAVFVAGYAALVAGVVLLIGGER